MTWYQHCQNFQPISTKSASECIKNCSNKGYFDFWTHNICQVWYWTIQEMASTDLNHGHVGQVIFTLASSCIFISYLIALLYLHNSAPEAFSAVDRCQRSAFSNGWFDWCFRNPAPPWCRGKAWRRVEFLDPKAVQDFFHQCTINLLKSATSRAWYISRWEPVPPQSPHQDLDICMMGEEIDSTWQLMATTPRKSQTAHNDHQYYQSQTQTMKE